MEKSEKISTVRPRDDRRPGQSPVTDALPFSGLGFDLGALPTVRLKVMAVEPVGPPAVTPRFDIPFPSGRRLQIALGREIRGR